MDAILKSFSISFLLRSTLSGAFFVLSLWVATGLCLQEEQRASITLIIGIAIFAGATVYSCHRAVVYPLLEWFFDSKSAESLRRRCPLIATHSIERMIERWGWSSSADDINNTIYAHTSTWADYTHFLYASSLAVILGGVTGCMIAGSLLSPNFPLVLLIGLLFLVAFVSDWRLHSLHDYLFTNHKLKTGQ
jgi:hypothetical protein